ncbi:hypothetical protein M758_5G000500 [Ceratodon purpureus]|nr:hypothetical protein M758_5G000500 [Ceratodon purpureus]KAG0614911.1 hypothetical protein M758_5G000500 [Ceratodon purpureus]
MLDVNLEDEAEEDGANVDLDSQRKGKCVVLKTSTRQVFVWGFLFEGFCFGVVQFLTVMLLVICTCTFVKIQAPKPMEQRTGFRGFF